MTTTIDIWTDGAALPTNPGPAAWAWWASDERWDAGYLGVSTNNAAELTAIMEAVQAAPTTVDLLVHADSQYAIKCLDPNGWQRGWRKRGWRNAKGDPVKNRSLIEDICDLIEAREGVVRFNWVRGHAGNHGNEQADRLANRCAQGRSDDHGPGWVTAVRSTM